MSADPGASDLKKIALFNHKGGVGKTTLSVNIADALVDAGKSVVLVDADPQCNLTSFYVEEGDLDRLQSESDEPGSDATLWSALKPVVEGRGGVGRVDGWAVRSGQITLLPGDVMLADYEEALPAAWVECFARRQRGYDVVTALRQVVDNAIAESNADVCIYDVGPNVGALNRSVLLDCDYFITPVAADLFSLRALGTVGRSVSKWLKEWATIRALAAPADQAALPLGEPVYLGYITSAFKVNAGRNAANPHADWESRIAPRVRDTVAKELRAVNPALVYSGGNKIGGIKHFHSLAPQAQTFGLAIGKLRGRVNSGQNDNVEEAASQFQALAHEIIRRTGI